MARHAGRAHSCTLVGSLQILDCSFFLASVFSFRVKFLYISCSVCFLSYKCAYFTASVLPFYERLFILGEFDFFLVGVLYFI